MIEPLGKEPRCADLLRPGMPGLWIQRRKENVCSAGDQNPVVSTHIDRATRAMLYEDTVKWAELARVSRVIELH
jgi:hypothetical protein